MIDVCFILEGTYPYVAGGVSTWVHQLISSMKDLRFGIVYIAPHSDPTRKIKYQVPNHVISLQEIYLHDYQLEPYAKRKPLQEDYERLRSFYENGLRGDFSEFPKLTTLFRGPESCFDAETIFKSKEVWDLLTHFYDQFSEKVSFLDYFWTWRGTHLPLFQILQAQIPPAKIYHSISTGYAGLLASIARHTYSSKFFLTEHGIYTYERMLEISQANWIFEQEKRTFRIERDLSFFKQWWVTLFQTMSRLAYHSADRIFTLYEGNKTREVLEGADPKKITIIPNGINTKNVKIAREKKSSPQIGLVGRVVTIKDIKTFIHAAKIVLKTIPQAEFYIIGPTDEEPDYYEECQTLTDTLNIQDKVHFTGRVSVNDYYRFLDIVVLTSLSEAQPYVILEANLAGIPMVTSDVGSCREMLEGMHEEDQQIGPSGLVTEVSHPESTAQAIIKLLQSPDIYQKMSESGKKRVSRYYDQDDLLSRYLNLYEQNL